jgi:hypothetical protein
VTHINAYTFWYTSKFQLASGFITRYLEEILYDPHIILINFFPHGATAPSGPGSLHYRGFTITLRHATIGRTPLDELSDRHRELYLTTHTTLTRDRRPCTQRDSNPQSQQARGRRPTALDRAATWIGTNQNYSQVFHMRYSHSFTAFHTRLQLLCIKLCFSH